MELHEFIAATLIQIVDGVERASLSIRPSGASVNPTGIEIDNGIAYCSTSELTYERESVQMVEFDIALTATEGSEQGAHIGVFLGPFGAGVKGKTQNENIAMNRIKFTVPLKLPPHASALPSRNF